MSIEQNVPPRGRRYLAATHRYDYLAREPFSISIIIINILTTITAGSHMIKGTRKFNSYGPTHGVDSSSIHEASYIDLTPET